MRAEAFGNSPFVDLLAAHSKPNGNASPVFEAVWWEQINLAATAWLIRGVLPRFGLAALYGPPGCGKSFVALLLARCIARGVDVLGARCKQTGVLYLGAEDTEGLRLRIAALRQEHDSEPIPFLFVPAPQEFNAGDADHMAALIDTARENAAEFEERGAPLGLIIADTFARSLPGLDENSAPAMSDAIAKLVAFGRELNALVLIVHHAGKDATRGLRGHSSLLAALDSSLEVQRDGDKRTLKLVKAKNGPDGLSWPVELKPVTLGDDSDGDPITSCVAEFGERQEPTPSSADQSKAPARAKLPTERLTGNNLIVARVIANAIRQNAGCPVMEDAVQPIGLAQLRSPDNGPRAAPQAWNRGVNKLLTEKIITRHDGQMAMGELHLAILAPTQEKQAIERAQTLCWQGWVAGEKRSNADGRPVFKEADLVSAIKCDGASKKPVEQIKAEVANGVLTAKTHGLIQTGEGGDLVILGQVTERGIAWDCDAQRQSEDIESQNNG
jgi:hypothetical protein